MSYGLDCQGIESRWGRDFPHVSRQSLSSPSLLYNGYQVFAGSKERTGSDTDHSPPSSTAVEKEYSYNSIATNGRTDCAEHQCLYSTVIPLFPLWAVRPVQTLSACTVQLYLYSPYGPYGLCRSSVTVQYSYTSIPTMGRTACADPQCLQSTAIPVFPLWAVQTLQNLCDCTIQLYLYSPYGPYSL